MSPEQARGKPVDKRTDIWAFGVVVYEMVMGRKLFEGEDLTETLASVVMKEPDFGGVPLRLRKVLEACLQKDPGQPLYRILHGRKAEKNSGGGWPYRRYVLGNRFG